MLTAHAKARKSIPAGVYFVCLYGGADEFVCTCFSSFISPVRVEVWKVVAAEETDRVAERYSLDGSFSFVAY